MQQIVLILPIMLLLSMCGPLDYFIVGNQTAPQPIPVTPPPPHPTNVTAPNTTQPQNITPPPPPAPPNVTAPNATAPNTTQADLQTWNSINSDFVGQECLAMAKAQTGMYSSMQECNCNEQWMVGVKNYDCSITTVQGGITVHVVCVQSTRLCSWASAVMNGSLTFDQIRQLQAQNGG